MRVLFAGKTQTRVVALYPIERERDGFTLPAARLVVEPRVRRSGGEQEMIEVTVMAVGSRFPKTAPQECRIAHRRRRQAGFLMHFSQHCRVGVSSFFHGSGRNLHTGLRDVTVREDQEFVSPRDVRNYFLDSIRHHAPMRRSCLPTPIAVLPSACAGRVPASARGRRARRAAPGPWRQTPLPARGQAHWALSLPVPRSQSPGQ